MNTFAYTALDAKGKIFHGSIVERSWTQAIRRVKEMGLFPTSVKEQTQRAIVERLKRIGQRTRSEAGATSSPVLFGRIPGKVLTAFTRQLATMIDAGISLVKGLRAIEQQEENRMLRIVLQKIITDIESGSTLSESLARHPKVFSKLYVNMVVSGETGGMLDRTLTRLADLLERTQKIRSKILTSLLYPAAVISVAMGILILLTVWIIPQFEKVFAGLAGGQGLPLFTQYVLGCSHFIQSHLLQFAVFIVAAVLAYKIVGRTRLGRERIDRMKLKLPIVGRIIRKVAVSRFARTLGAMLENGVPVLQALTITRDTTSNSAVARAIEQTHDSVKEGETLTDPLRASGIFPSTVISMIDAGEQSGALPGMLLKVADNYETEVDNAIAGALSLLEPVLIIFLAIVVGTIVIAMFLPIINIIPGANPNSDADI